MKKSFELKGTKTGLVLIMNPEADIRDMILDICREFSENRQFFGRNNIVLTLRGRHLDPEEYEAVIEAIELNSDVRVRIVEDDDGLHEKEMLGKIDGMKMKAISEYSLIVPNDVTDDSTIRSDRSLLVIGNVGKDATLIAAGNIIVTGLLSGRAVAGYKSNRNTDFYIYAGVINTDRMSIGDYDTMSSADDRTRKRIVRKRRITEEGDVVMFNRNHFIMTTVNDELFKNRFKR